MADSVARAAAHLFQPRDHYRFGGGAGAGPAVGRNPPQGVTVYFALRARPDSGQRASLTFMDSAGATIRTVTLNRDSLRVGLNRYTWNTRYPDAATFQGLIMWAGSVTGPLAPPGRYQVRLTIGEQSQTRSFRLLADPRSTASPADYAAQFALLTRIRDRLSDANNAVTRIRDLKAQLAAVLQRAGPMTDSVRPMAESLRTRLSAIEEEIYQVRNQSSQDPLNYPIRLNNRIAALAGVVASADARPTDQSVEVFEMLSAALETQLAALRRVVETDVPAFNARVRTLDIPALFVRESGARRP
jgi:enamine deaminase RidA (YjgF/YER057c/UK114 family)